jgi:hypothetical protein
LWHASSGITHLNRDRDAAEITWWSSDAPMRENMRKLCDLYRANDYSHANFQIDAFRSLGSHHAFADLHWDLFRKNGEPLQSFNTGYNLIRARDGIRALMVTQYEEDIANTKQDGKDISNAAQ